MDMKAAFSNYFLKLDSLYSGTFGTKPTVPYSDMLNKALFIGSPDEDGEIQWEPKEQGVRYDWKAVEATLGFLLCQELKDYYNTFFFLTLPGTFGNSELHFYKVDGSESLGKVALRNFNDAQHVFPGTHMFLIGNATVNDDDSYFIYFDNATGKLFCYEADMRNEVVLSYSIAKTIGSMEASL